MQVSQQDDFITHAVIGNQETVEMGVSDDAALMHILSSTLYTHPKLAVVREIICNGWDAHIAAGKTDTPLQITLTSTQLTVRDFGFGIAHAEIGPIYGVYGNSTKRGDSKSTGGFGLGSKAPFAYTDNFEVASHHLGVKTIYRVSKSSMEKGGKPSINKIVSLPTDETGIAVSFGIQAQDQQEFLKLIREVLILGEIQASINGADPLVTLPLSTSPTGYAITDFRGTVGQEINLRYGNVVYPVPYRDEYGTQYHHIVNDLRRLWSDATITFMAPPDSISIAPNREAIILTDATVNTVKSLLDTYDFKGRESSEVAVRQLCNAVLNTQVREAETSTLRTWYTSEERLDCTPVIAKETVVGRFSTTIKQAAMQVAAHYLGPRIPSDLMQRRMLQELVRRGEVFKPLAKALLRKKDPSLSGWNGRRTALSLVTRHLDFPLQEALKTVPALQEVAYQTYLNTGSYHYGFFCKSYEAAYESRRDITVMLYKHALITRNQKQAQEYFRNNASTRLRTYLVMYVGYNKKSEQTKEQLNQFLEQQGYAVEVHLPERARVVRDPTLPKKEPMRRKKKDGYLSLTHSYNKDTGSFLLSHAREHFTDDTLIEKPIAWVTLRPSSERDHCIDNFNSSTSKLIQKHWGDQIAVVTHAQAKKLTEQGIEQVTQFLNKYADEKLATSPDIKRFAAFAGRLQPRYCDNHKILFNACFHEELMKSMGLRFHISPENAVLMKICRNMEHVLSSFEKCKEATQHVKEHPLLKTCKEKMENSPWADFIDLNHLANAMEEVTPGSAECEIPYTLVRNLLK
ncbi:ATP-binding protein [Stutzerimonas stutzeri]|uniref:RIIA-like protein n=1 Tax=Stutzerimonas stutzeri TaxID=316 RepID=A0AA42PAX9_STUST|nr:ATP-binding protein [Stutzerimonas stutzeri]MDH1236492.1 hypothetical protein [Stutzerimonas stutzeri]